MDRLKDFIKHNRTLFDNTELPEDHLQHFMEKLERAENKSDLSYRVSDCNDSSNRRRVLFKWMASLAAASIAFLLYWKIPEYISQLQTEQEYTCELHTEMDELRIYYQMQIADLMMKMEEADKKTNNREIKELIMAGRKIETECRRFDEDTYPSLPCSDIGVLVVNRQYANSLNGLRTLYGRVTEIKQE